MPYNVQNDLFHATKAAQSWLVERSVPVVGGLNNRFAPQMLQDGQLSGSINVDLSDPTRPASRDGYSTIASGQENIDAGLLDKRINGMGVLSPSGTADTSLVVTIPDAGSGKTYRTTNTTGAWVEVATSAPASYDPGAASDVPMAQVNDCLYILGSTPAAMDSAGLLTISTNTDDTTGPDVLGSPPHNGVDICYAFNRAWILTTTSAVGPPALNYSITLPTAAGLNASWARAEVYSDTTVAGRLLLSPNNSAVARGVLPWMGQSLIVFFDNSTEEVRLSSFGPSGEPAYSDPFTYAQRAVLEPRFGLIGRRAKAAMGQEIYFMDQYGSIRRLSRTVNDANAGVSPLPLSEQIAGELPGRLNLVHASKVIITIFRQRMFVDYPRDAATECSHRCIYNLAYGFWETVAAPRDPIGHVVVTDVRGAGANGHEMFTSDGTSGASAESLVYRWYDGSYADNGAAIPYTETLRGFHFDRPESPKVFEDFELEAVATAGVEAHVDMQVDENGRWFRAAATWKAQVTPSSWPLTDSSFPLTDSSFPLIDATPIVRRKVMSWEGFEGVGENGRRGRFARFRVTSEPPPGERFSRVGWRFRAQIESVHWEREE